MTYRAKVIELFWPMHNSHIHSTTADTHNYSNDYAYVLKNYATQSYNETYGKWIKHLHEQ